MAGSGGGGDGDRNGSGDDGNNGGSGGGKNIRSAKQDVNYGASNIILPCPGS